MSAHRIIFASRKVKIAAACIAALLLVAGAWGAQHVMKRFVFDFPEEPVTKTLTAPDGTEKHLSTSSTFRISTDDPDFTEAEARQRHEGIKKAIEDGAAELIEIKETDLGSSAYIYKATLDNGEEVTWASGRRLYDPDEAELTAEFEQAIVEGRGEVVKTIEGEYGDVYIYKVILSDGSARTYGSGRPPGTETDAEFEQAKVEGRGEVVKTIEGEHGEVYIYKVILSDGSARTYGSNRPPAEQ